MGWGGVTSKSWKKDTKSENQLIDHSLPLLTGTRRVRKTDTGRSRKTDPEMERKRGTY